MTIKAIEILSTSANGNKKVIAEIDCSRCSGNGRLESYRHIDQGLCFKCGGTGAQKVKITVKPNEEIVMIEETTAIKPILTKVNHDAVMMKNAMMRINEEKKAAHQAYLDLVEREAREKREMEEDKKNNPDQYRFTWDD